MEKNVLHNNYNLIKKKILINFWAEISRDYKQLSDQVIKFMLPFKSTELVDGQTDFSFFLFIY